jgi:hypothetical protein
VIRLLIDEDFNDHIIEGAFQRLPSLEAIRARDTGLRGRHDREVLAWAAEHNRILFTHDQCTMPKHAYERVIAGMRMPGVFVVGQDLPIIDAINDLILVAECSAEGEWDGQVKYLPL